MQINNTLFKRKILSFTLIQVALLSFLLILSVAVRLVLYPLSYLESLPLYFIVGFFFLWRVGISLLAGGCISFFLSAQPLFTALLFLMFLVAECIFDMIFYRRFLKE